MPSRTEKPVVFLNCRIDQGNRTLMYAMVFAILACGCRVHAAEEKMDAGKARLRHIFKLIKKCNLGIHDISMVQLDPKTRVPRFNMPFELGLFLGAIAFGPKHKECLIFAHHKYNFSKCLSDMAGRDVEVHGGSERKAMRVVRRFLSQQKPEVPGESTIWRQYQAFQAQFSALPKGSKLNPKEIEFNDYVNLVLRWLKFQSPVLF